MPLFGRRVSLEDAVERLREELRNGSAPAALVEELRRGGTAAGAVRAPPGLQELLEAIADGAALLEAGARMVARNQPMRQLLGAGATVLEATRSDELVELCNRGLSGRPDQCEVALPSLGLQIHAQVTPLSQARALLVVRDLTAARRADRVRRDFIANASHELRTPVTAIRGAAETLLEGGLDLPGQARSFVEVISRHADRLSRLTEDLLDLSKLETGAWKPVAEPVQLAPLCASVVELFRERAAKKSIALEVEVAGGLHASAERRALEQILVNLLDNAVKFTPAGGSVTLLGEGSPPIVTLSVVDTGPGIEAQHQGRIFERFYRADAGRSREVGGTGLGLSIVKHLSQAMGGEAGVESSGSGSRFWVRLPSA